ncbi:MAG: T9SS type A sorting domain-containing protein [Bacteroidetes bacterium]|nr:T9SS type A sorting domain-containing protein [Bacteroidota bacterium]MBP7398896.1 T9SS type A sorting domain-containing protein [Chitinophagales bacterium]MBK7109032.1 T9SS type A sorting domain-containing protein [Bacteroidota bacterium]MBK8488648.1 T9SS type A sorting domain-containing protein [Bacteroidota bacterium]MBK8681591.1 T9SS type A sorting domain-containing protein [Bacteroidota bacterium]
MKKFNYPTIILVSAILLLGILFPMQNVMAQAAEEQLQYSPMQITSMDQPILHKWQGANAIKRSEKSGSRYAVSYVAIGTAYNLFTILLSEQAQVSYNPDINSITFIHRQNDLTAGGSGGLSYDLSTDGGAIWSTNNILTPAFNSGTELPDMTGGRYPSATIWNPEGNTDPNSAYIVGHGPELTPITAGSWGATYKVSQKLDGDDNSESYYSEGDLSADYHAYGIQAYQSGSMWDIKSNTSYNTYYVNEITFDGISGFDYNTTTITNDWYAVQPKAQCVFDESGTIGYIVIIGARLDEVETNMYPTILKTIDAGATWDYLPYFNIGSLPAMESTLLVADDGITYRPFFSDFDATVDANGRLHIISDIESGSLADPVSIYSYYSSFSAVMHTSVSDGTDWDAEALGSTNQLDYVFGTAPVDHSPQISRTEDGSKVFFSWTMSPELNLSHDSPNLMAKGYDISSDSYSPTVDFTTGTDFENNCFFPTMAPVCKDLGGTYELPIVFADPGATDLVAPQFYYAAGVTFIDDDFGGCFPAPPTDIYADGITATTATIHWTIAPGTSASRLVVWELSTGKVVKYIIYDGDSFTVPGELSPSTTYGARLKSGCNVDEVWTPGEYSEWYYFTTDPLREGEFTKEVSVYPNPNNGNFNIQLNGYENGKAQIQIMNAVGQVMYDATISIDANASVHDVSLNLAAGTYIVKVINGSEIVTNTIIVE